MVSNWDILLGFSRQVGPNSKEVSSVQVLSYVLDALETSFYFVYE